MPQKALPVLQVDGGEYLCQSGAINRYLARELGKCWFFDIEQLLQIRALPYFQNNKYQNLLIKPYVVGTHWNRLCETILMSTHNIGFGREPMD